MGDGLAAEAAELALEKEAANDRTGDEAKAIGRTEQNHHAVWVGRHQWCQEREDDLGQRDAGDDEGRRPGFLAGIEHAQVQQHQGIRDECEGGEADGQAELLGALGAVGTVLEEGAGDRNAEAGHEDDDGDKCDEGQLGAQGEIADHGIYIAVGGVAGQARHNCRQERHADNAIRHLQHEPGILIDQRCARIRVCGHAGGDHVAQLGDGHIGNDGQSHAAELLDARIQAPFGAQVNAGLFQIRQ